MATEYTSLDARRIAAFSGVMAAGLSADSEIFQFRWANASQRAIVLDVSLSAANDGTAFAAGTALFSVMKASGWTVDGSGGSAVTLTGNNGKLNNVISAQVLPTVRISSTAALTAGTKTELLRIGSAVGGVVATAGTVVLPPTTLYSDAFTGLQPVVLGNEEGFTVKATVPATGTWKFNVNVAYVVLS